jgi:hypothetical protein
VQLDTEGALRKPEPARMRAVAGYGLLTRVVRVLVGPGRVQTPTKCSARSKGSSSSLPCAHGVAGVQYSHQTLCPSCSFR